MKWQPPIPAGALCSPDAIAINTALPLLGWCYDQVGRDGWFEINLRAVALDINVEYWTVKRWWAALSASSFITKVEGHGRGGMRARLADEWIDWRQLNKRETGSYLRPNSESGYVNGTETGSEMLPNAANRNINGTETGANMIPNNNVYGTQDSDQAESHGGGEDQDRTARSAPPVVALVWEYFPHEQISADETDDISSTVRDLAVWRTSLQIWRRNKWPFRLGNLLDRYDKELARANKGQSNGKHVRSGAGQHSERAPQVEADPDKPW